MNANLFVSSYQPCVQDANEWSSPILYMSSLQQKFVLKNIIYIHTFYIESNSLVIYGAQNLINFSDLPLLGDSNICQKVKKCAPLATKFTFLV